MSHGHEIPDVPGADAHGPSRSARRPRRGAPRPSLLVLREDGALAAAQPVVVHDVVVDQQGGVDDLHGGRGRAGRGRRGGAVGRTSRIPGGAGPPRTILPRGRRKLRRPAHARRAPTALTAAQQSRAPLRRSCRRSSRRRSGGFFARARPGRRDLCARRRLVLLAPRSPRPRDDLSE